MRDVHWTVREIDPRSGAVRDHRQISPKRKAHALAEEIRAGNKGKGTIVRRGHMYIVTRGSA